MLTTQQAVLTKRTLTAIIAKNKTLNDANVRAYQNKLPPNALYENAQREEESEAMQAILDNLTVITEPQAG